MWINELNKEQLSSILGKVEYKCSHIGKEQYNIALVPCGFDIETTREFMYVWTCSINTTTIFGTTWAEFQTLIDMIKDVLNLGLMVDHRPKVFPMFIHNFGGFEWHFMSSQLNFTNRFCVGSNALFGVIDDTIVVLDSYRICPNKLDDLAKMYSTYRKLDGGEFDYFKERNTNDAKSMTEREMEYCATDTLILVDFAKHIINDYFMIYGRLPYTQNEIVRGMIKSAYNDNKDLYEPQIKDLFPDRLDYEWFRMFGYRGGFCGSSMDDCYGDVGYADLDSAYCSAVVHQYFPMTRYKTVRPDLFEQYCETHCCQMTLEFTNIKSKTFIRPEQLSHCIPESGKYGDGCTWDNASHLVSADKIVVSICELDWELYKLCYNWDSVKCLKCKVSERGHLPEYVIQVALKLYGDKALLKLDGKDETAEYKRVKSLPSTITGAMGKRINKKYMKLNSDDWAKQFKRINKQILFPQWALYVTAHIRSLVVKTALSIGSYYWLYSDTDSLLHKGDDIVKDVFLEHNELQQLRNLAMCNERGLDYNIYKNLGCWDFGERKGLKIDAFKTIGSKAYIYHYTDNKHPEGAFKVVLGGIPEQDFWDSFDKVYNERTIENVFKFFEPDTQITYHKKYAIIVNDTSAVINGQKMYCKSGVRIDDTEITGDIRTLRKCLPIMRKLDEKDDKVQADL